MRKLTVCTVPLHALMGITIRQAKSEDVPAIIQLQTSSLKVLCAGDYAPDQLEVLVGDQARSRTVDEVLWIAETEGKVVGFSGLSASDRQITAVYVRPEWVRRGIGKQMLAALEVEAMNRGYRVLWVLSSLTAVPFYQAQGYRLLYKTRLWSPSTCCGIPCVRLEKRLLPATFAEKYSLWIVVIVFVLLVFVSLLMTVLQ